MAYFSGGVPCPSPEGVSTSDICDREIAKTLQLVVWLHGIDMYFCHGRTATRSLRLEDHVCGKLLKFFLGGGHCPLTMDAIARQGVEENLVDLWGELREVEEFLRQAQNSHQTYTEELSQAEATLEKIKKKPKPEQPKRSKKNAEKKQECLLAEVLTARQDVKDFQHWIRYFKALLTKVPPKEVEAILNEPDPHPTTNLIPPSQAADPKRSLLQRQNSRQGMKTTRKRKRTQILSCRKKKKMTPQKSQNRRVWRWMRKEMTLCLDKAPPESSS